MAFDLASAVDVEDEAPAKKPRFDLASAVDVADAPAERPSVWQTALDTVHDVAGGVGNAAREGLRGVGAVEGALEGLITGNPEAVRLGQEAGAAMLPHTEMRSPAGKAVVAGMDAVGAQLAPVLADFDAKREAISPTGNKLFKAAATGAGAALAAAPLAGAVEGAVPALARVAPTPESLKALGDKITAKVMGGPTAKQDATKLRAVSSAPAGELTPEQVAKQAGIIIRHSDLPPEQTLGSNGGARGTLEALSGNRGRKVLNDINQTRFSQIVKDDVGVRDLTDSGFNEGAAKHYSPYERAKKIPELPEHEGYTRAINSITNNRNLSKDAFSKVADLQRQYATPGTPEQLVESVKSLREDAAKNIQKGTVDEGHVGRAQRAVADAMDDELHRRAVSAGDYKLVEELKASRRAIAKIRTAQETSRAGHTDPQAVLEAEKAGAKLDGGMAVVAHVAEHFPEVSKHFQKITDIGEREFSHPSVYNVVARAAQRIPTAFLKRSAVEQGGVGPSLDPALVNNPMFTRPAPTPAPFELQRPPGGAFQPLQRDAQLAGQNPLPLNLDQQLAMELNAQGVPPASLNQQLDAFGPQSPIDAIAELRLERGSPTLPLRPGDTPLRDQLAGDFGIQGPGRQYGSLAELAQELGGGVPPRYSELAPAQSAPAAPSAVLPGPFGSTARGAPEAIRRIAGAAPDADFAVALQQLEGLGYYGGARVNVAPHASQLADFAVPETPGPAINTRGLALDDGGIEEFIRQMAAGKSIEQILAERAR